MEGGRERKMRVVLVACPLQGHITPMLDLATILHSNGFSITIAHTIFNSPNPSNHPSDFTFLPIADGLINPDTSPSNNIAFSNQINSNCQAPFKEAMSQMMTRHAGDNVGLCIVYDRLMTFAEAVAAQLKIPSIILRTSGASSSLAFIEIPRLVDEGYFPFQESKLLDPVPGLHPLKFKDISLKKLGKIEDILLVIVDGKNTKTSSAIIWNTIDCLEHSSLSQLHQQYYNVPFFSIGPLNKMAHSSSTSLLKEDTSCITWLDNQDPRSVIYVSLGSLATVNEKEVAEMAWGLANSGQPFLWVVRPGSVCGSKWTELLPEGFKEETKGRGLLVKWAPQKEVLAHWAIGGFWSHCGWNSTLESMSEGVPMICMPIFGDQKVNARYVSCAWKVGVQLECELERGDMERAIRRVVEDEEGKEIRQRANDMKEKIALATKKGGSSYNSVNDLVEFIMSFRFLN